MYEKYMLEALKEAEIAFSKGEVPIGAVLVSDNKIISRAHNTRVSDRCVLGHAEINVLRKISKEIEDWRLKKCTLYVTLLPCPMCASALNQARIERVICGTVPNNSDYPLIYQILKDNNYGSPIEIITGVLEEECSKLLKDFFVQKRN